MKFLANDLRGCFHPLSSSSSLTWTEFLSNVCCPVAGETEPTDGVYRLSTLLNSSRWMDVSVPNADYDVTPSQSRDGPFESNALATLHYSKRM